MGNLKWLEKEHLLTSELKAWQKAINGYAFHQLSGFSNVADVMVVSVLDNGGSKVQLIVPDSARVNEEMGEIAIGGYWTPLQGAFMLGEVKILADATGEIVYSHA